MALLKKQLKLVPRRNDAVTRQIMAAIASTHSFHLAAKIESILDENFKHRRAGSACRNGQGAARTGDKATSVEAALLVKVNPQQKKILSVLRLIERPITANDISIVSRVKLNSASTRMKELVAKGMIAEVGQRREEGRKRTTYRITDHGREWSLSLDQPTAQAA